MFFKVLQMHCLMHTFLGQMIFDLNEGDFLKTKKITNGQDDSCTIGTLPVFKLLRFKGHQLIITVLQV